MADEPEVPEIQIDVEMISDGVAFVTFKNPYYTGQFMDIVIEQEQFMEAGVDGQMHKVLRPVPRQRDNDPHPHQSKEIKVSYKNGEFDMEAFDALIEQHKAAARARFDQRKASLQG